MIHLRLLFQCLPPPWVLSPVLYLRSVYAFSNRRRVCSQSGASARVPRAMACKRSSKLLSPPAKPDLTQQAHGAKPAALQGGQWPSPGARPEQLPLVSVHGPAGPPTWCRDREPGESPERALLQSGERKDSKAQGAQLSHQQEGPVLWRFIVRGSALQGRHGGWATSREGQEELGACGPLGPLLFLQHKRLIPQKVFSWPGVEISRCLSPHWCWGWRRTRLAAAVPGGDRLEAVPRPRTRQSGLCLFPMRN